MLESLQEFIKPYFQQPLRRQWEMDDAGNFQEDDLELRSRTHPPVDPNRLDYLRDLMEDAFSELIDLFLENVPKQMNALKASAEKGDMRTLYRLAHSIKASSAHLGADTLSELCQDLEMEGRKNNTEGNALLIERIESELQRVKNVLEVTREKFG